MWRVEAARTEVEEKKMATKTWGKIMVCNVEYEEDGRAAFLPLVGLPEFKTTAEAEKVVRKRADGKDYAVIRLVKAIRTEEVVQVKTVELDLFGDNHESQ